MIVLQFLNIELLKIDNNMIFFSYLKTCIILILFKDR